MIRDRPAPVGGMDRNPIERLAHPSPADMHRTSHSPQRIDRKMLGQQQGIADAILHPGLVGPHLDTTGILVVGETEVKEVADHLAAGRLRRIFSWVAFRTTERRATGSDPSLSNACQRSDIL